MDIPTTRKKSKVTRAMGTNEEIQTKAKQGVILSKVDRAYSGLV